MKGTVITRYSIIPVLILLIGAGCEQGPGREELTARNYCSSCHLFPEPSLLDKTTWTRNILPRMGSLAGIKYYMGQPYVDVYELEHRSDSLTAVNPSIALDDWKMIIDYYQSHAPDSALPQDRPPVTLFTHLFSSTAFPADSGEYPSTSFVRIDPGNHWIYAANAWDSSLHIYNDADQQISKVKLKGIVPDIYFTGSLLERGSREGTVTNIGIMNPNDLSTGSADSFFIDSNARLKYLKPRLSNLPRPMQTIPADFDQDGRTDYLVNGFGNSRGWLCWMRNEGNGKYQMQIIRPLPGAIKSIVRDFNNDGKPDIMTLMAQAREGIYLFLNQGKGKFQTLPLLEFPPVYGSTSFELDDFNNDGKPDILYTCGDNAKYSSNELMKFHGIYIYLNDGNNHFREKYFFPIHGCYKAVARDFDNDGDLDIASIAYYPDEKKQPQESFVYLENKGDLHFKPFGIPQFGEGHWLTLDAGDLDGDGDQDIVIGSLVPPAATWRPLDTKQPRPVAFLLLRNNTFKSH